MNDVIKELKQYGDIYIFGSSIKDVEKYNDIDIAIIHPDNISFENQICEKLSNETVRKSNIQPLLNYTKPENHISYQKKYHILYCPISVFNNTSHPIKEKVKSGLRIN
ncbi:MAG: nucleotidyltransferase domain-containing protein [Ignavibacteria bacterium]|jgi:hypothetical protein